MRVNRCTLIPSSFCRLIASPTPPPLAEHGEAEEEELPAGGELPAGAAALLAAAAVAASAPVGVEGEEASAEAQAGVGEAASVVLVAGEPRLHASCGG